jgi:polar amino acid transport system substrate-binding protein
MAGVWSDDHMRLKVWATVIVLCISATLQAEAQAPSAGSDPPRRVALRFLTDNDFPPFNYVGEDGSLVGFNVDLARAICLEIGATCDIQARPWEQLLPALAKGQADALIAGHATSARALAAADFSDTYFHTPARFAGLKKSALADVSPEGLMGKRIGVAKGTAHEAFLRAFFYESAIQPFENAELARDALIAGKVDLVFDDGVSLVFWLGGLLSKDCCEFKGGPYFEARYFGDGMAVAVGRTDVQLKSLINAALRKLRESGRFDELVLRYFPTRVY